MKLFPRLMKHLFTTKAAGKRAFPPPTLHAIEATIAEGEKLHRAEVRLIVEHALPFAAVLHRVTSRQRTVDLFARYRIWDTEENCGVLVYVNIADRKVEIVADRDVAQRVTQADWDDVCRTMTDGFKQGEFRDSSSAAMTKLNALLASHYPANGDHPNQLSDKPIVL